MSTAAWTPEEIDYLMENWGRTSIPHMAKKLDRSVNAVILKAKKQGLGAFLDGGELVSFAQLVQAIGKSGSYSWYRQKWARYGFPFRQKKVINNSFIMVDIREFWKWAEQHKDILNFSDFEEYALGKEPAWVNEKRRQDCRKRRREAREWTPEEDSRLRGMLKAHRYSLDEIAEALNRREGAIRRRIDTLGMKERPVRNPGKWWTQEEIETMQRLHAEGMAWEDIGARIGRTASACRGRYERLLNPDAMTREVRDNKKALRPFFQKNQCTHYTKACGCDIRGTDCDACAEYRRRDPEESFTTGWISSKAGHDGKARVMEGTP